MAKKKQVKKVAKKKNKKVVKKTMKKVIKKIGKAKPKVKTAKKIKVKVVVKGPKEKVLGIIEHYFDHISVAAIKILAPIKVGDVIHVKGHTTDFVQKLESMQIEHQSVDKAKKGDDIGIKVKEKVREHDKLYLASQKEIAAQKKPVAIQQPMFPSIVQGKTMTNVKPGKKKAGVSAPKPNEPKTDNPYENKKFFAF
jgi:putative protease